MGQKVPLGDRGSLDRAMAGVAQVASDTVSSENTKPALKTIAVRINEKEYRELDALFSAQGTSMAAAGKAAIFYIADMVKSGEISIPNGVIVEKRK
jgi:hypothetical protein